MTNARRRWLDIVCQAALSLLFAGALFELGVWLFHWYGQDLEFMRTARTSSYFHSSMKPLYLLIIQGFLNFSTRKPWIVLLPVAYVGAALLGTFAWSGPGDEANVASNLQLVEIAITGGLLVLNTLLCRVALPRFPEPVRTPAPRQLQFDF